MKKRLLAFALSVIALTVALSATFSVTAYTKSDLLKEFKTIPSSRYVIADIENLARTFELTEEQCDKLWVILAEVKALLPKDLGPSVHQGDNYGERKRVYDSEVVAKVMNCIRAACRITGCTFVKSVVPESTHDLDIIFRLYDKYGKLIFEYDGDLIQKTGADENDLSLGSVALWGGAAFIAMAGGVAVYGVKKEKVLASRG